MRNHNARCALIIALIMLVALTATVSYANTAAVRFFSEGRLIAVNRAVTNDVPLAEAAVRALVAGPFVEETAVGITSRIPAGVKIKKLSIAGSVAEIDLSSEILIGFDEAGLVDIFDQFRSTLSEFPSIMTIKLTSGGKLLSSFLPSAPEIGEPAAPLVKGNAVGLSGKKICVGPSHGRLFTGTWYGWQRGDFCNFGEAVLEDTNSIRLVQFLKQYIVQDGGTFSSPRELDETNCCHPDTGMAWWKMCAMSWLKKTGVPCSVWASSSGNCGAENATNRNSDDIRCRPLYADYMGADIYIAHHTNAAGSSPSNANGTVTYRDSTMTYSAHRTNSLNLATAIQNNIVATIRNTFPGESSWYDRHVLDSAGGFGEIRIPNRPACLIELAFHDNCERDGLYLTDDFFRSLSEWAVYKGICEYFGNTPTWDKYSCELVSDTIPTSMMPGQTYNVSVTMRNRGVCWMSTYGFKLGAFGDSDPFASTRHNVSGTIRPGQTFTFNFTMKAPMIPGTYVSDWQMLRESYQWFGPKLVKNITVVSIDDDEPPTAPTNLRVTGTTSSSISLAWNASTDNIGVAGYRIFRNGTQIGTATGTTYNDTGLANNTTYTYQVDAYDGKPNYSPKSNSVQATTIAVIFQDGFANLNNWVLDPVADNNVMPTLSSAQNHGSISGANSVYFPGNVVSWIYHDFSPNLTSGGYRSGVLSGWMYDNAVSNLRIGMRAYTYNSSGSNKGLYWIGVSNGNPPGIPLKYMAAVYDSGWIYHDLGDRSAGWHKFTIEILPYTGSNDLKFYVDGALKLTTNQPASVANTVLRRAYLGYNYTPNQPTYWDDITLESTAPAAPTNVSGTALSTTSIRWNFTDKANNEIGHRVYNGSTKVAEREVIDISYVDEADLQPNTTYNRTVKAYAGTLTSVGANGSGTTLSVPPSTSNVTCDKNVNVTYGDNKFTFTAVGGFGAGKVDHYMVAWDKQATHTWTGSEGAWSNGTLVQTAASTGSWYLHLRGVNSAGVANGTLDLGPFIYNSDSVAPTINSVSVAPAMVLGGDAVHVTVDATDNVGVTSVKANGVSLTNTGGNIWAGDLFASGALGSHFISVVAQDGAGNSATDTSGSYLTTLVRGASNKSAWGVEMNSASTIYLFKFWGKVTEVDNDKFTLDDGSGSPITVIAPGYKTKVSTGDYAAARGILSIDGLSRAIQSEVDLITKY
ncbi:MAG: hypothetical protein GX139_04735 [Armatimonadetes bacterium]|jgi:hypothetical protein|nr:hypothetical protein [Armatimonadota bacterium]